jgi:hypothetical protein
MLAALVFTSGRGPTVSGHGVGAGAGLDIELNRPGKLGVFVVRGRCGIVRAFVGASAENIVQCMPGVGWRDEHH